MKPTHLPIERMKAELTDKLCAYREATGKGLDIMDANLTLEIRCGDYCLGVSFPDGPAWLVPFDPEANAIMQGLSAVHH